MPVEENASFEAGKLIFGEYLPFLDVSALSSHLFPLCFAGYSLLHSQC